MQMYEISKLTIMPCGTSSDRYFCPHHDCSFSAIKAVGLETHMLPKVEISSLGMKLIPHTSIRSVWSSMKSKTYYEGTDFETQICTCLVCGLTLEESDAWSKMKDHCMGCGIKSPSTGGANVGSK
jgi:hypothetical protein